LSSAGYGDDEYEEKNPEEMAEEVAYFHYGRVGCHDGVPQLYEGKKGSRVLEQPGLFKVKILHAAKRRGLA
jgi:hypothetical protein